MSKYRYQEKKNQQRGVKSFADLAPPRPVSNLPDWPDMHQWEKDGEDHICIERKAKTELGRFLCTDNGDFPFTSRYFGRFNCLEGFWLYVTCPNFSRREHLRTVYGSAMQGIRRDAMATQVKTNNLRAIMMQAMYDRIVQNEKLRDLFIDNTLPFDMYHIDTETGRRMRAPHMMHMVFVGYHLLFLCLYEGSDIDSAIQHARNNKEGDMYADLLPPYQIEWLKNQERIRLEKEERKRLDALAEEEAQKERAERDALNARLESESEQPSGDVVIVQEPIAEDYDPVVSTVSESKESEIVTPAGSVGSVPIWPIDHTSLVPASDLPETAEVIEVKPSDLTKDQIGSILLEQAQEVIEVIADNQ